MKPLLFRYRSRELYAHDIAFIRATIGEHYTKGRSHISRVLCNAWAWRQPDGKLKEFAARDLLLRLEEKGFIELPPRKRPKNNLKPKRFDQIPFLIKKALGSSIKDFPSLEIRLVSSQDSYLWNYLVHHYHYLGLPKLVGEHLRYLAFINGQVVACLGWTSAAWKVKDRDRFIGWDEPTKRKNLYLIANNARFLILPWIRIKYLASKLLSLNLRHLSRDWQKTYGHAVYLAETFVDNARFQGTCYQAANWQYVGQTKGSAKKGNAYHYHGQLKGIYLYPLHRHFRRLLNDDQG
jgi:hypothetical protein